MRKVFQDLLITAKARTGDRDAAISMLAIKPTNLSHDIAPSWLVSEVSVFSQSEFKRRPLRF